VIHDDLVATFGPKAVAYNTVTGYLRGAKFSRAEVTLDPEPSSLHLDDGDRALLAALEEKKSYFCPCENLPEPPISLDFLRRLLRWVVHRLSNAQKVRRVELSLSFVRMLEVQEQRA
jgi:hypothetical protein